MWSLYVVDDVGGDIGNFNGGWEIFITPAPVCVSGFTNDPLQAGATIVEAVHITELRQRVDALRIRFGLGVYSWTDPTLTVGATSVRAVHLTDLRTALSAAYVAASVTPPTYTDPSLSAGTAVKVVHITQLRAAIVAIQ